MYDRLMEKQKAFEETHVRVRDDDMFKWFEQEGLIILKSYTDRATKLAFEVDETGITVNIITTNLVLLPADETGLMEVLNRAATCFVNINSEGKLEIKLWFRGWKWLEKDNIDTDVGCSSMSNSVE